MPNTSPVLKAESYLLEKFGIENLLFKQTAQSNLGAGQVRVRLHAASLNFRDLLVVKGLYDPRVLANGALIPLSDAAGEIIELAPDVSRFKIGDRVAGIFFQKWLNGECNQDVTKSALGGTIDGVLTSHKIFDQEGLVHLPKDYSYEEGATLPCAAVTAWHALTGSGLKAGDSVLIQGTGGVSIFALQFAKASGAKVLLISSSNEKLEKAKKLGADFLINYKEKPDWQEEIRKLTNGQGVDHIIEVGGIQTLPKSFKAARVGGTVSMIGILSGTENDVSLLPILMKTLLIRGIYVGSRSMFESMNKAIETNDLRPIIDKVFTFKEVKEAFQHLESASHFGKVVIKID
jgi:NADPH:quinone reductase-like Zn-dependent oxidoreductase